MAMPTDRGYAVVSDNDDGTTTVMVCTGIEDGEPINVFAMHVRQPKVAIGSDVRLIHAKSYRHTDQLVEVFVGDGAVHVCAPSRRKGPLPA